MEEASAAETSSEAAPPSGAFGALAEEARPASVKDMETFESPAKEAEAAAKLQAEEVAAAQTQDNDDDGHTDCHDSDCCEDNACSNAPNCQNGGGGNNNPEIQCTDGVDNDGDNQTDCNDPDCCEDNACSTEPHCNHNDQEDVCNDGYDNDNDGFTDCADSDCNNAPNCNGGSGPGSGAGNGSDGQCEEINGDYNCMDPDCCMYAFCTCFWPCAPYVAKRSDPFPRTP